MAADELVEVGVEGRSKPTNCFSAYYFNQIDTYFRNVTYVKLVSFDFQRPRWWNRGGRTTHKGCCLRRSTSRLPSRALLHVRIALEKSLNPALDICCNFISPLAASI